VLRLRPFLSPTPRERDRGSSRLADSATRFFALRKPRFLSFGRHDASPRTLVGRLPFTFVAHHDFPRHNTRTHVRLLGPCFKTGRLNPFFSRILRRTVFETFGTFESSLFPSAGRSFRGIFLFRPDGLSVYAACASRVELPDGDSVERALPTSNA